jgi:hypothetical protein
MLTLWWGHFGEPLELRLLEAKPAQPGPDLLQRLILGFGGLWGVVWQQVMIPFRQDDLDIDGHDVTIGRLQQLT